MSNTQHICACGKNRKRAPLIITVTTCRRKRSSSVEGSGSFCTHCGKSLETSGEVPNQDNNQRTSDKRSFESYKTAYVGVAEYATEEKPSDNISDSAKENKLSVNNGHKERLSIVEETQEEDKVLNYVLDETLTDEEPRDAKMAEIQGEPQKLITLGESFNSAINKEDEHEAEDAPEQNTSNNMDDNPTVMALKETAVNTVPLFESLFCSEDRSKTKFEMDDQKDGCVMELFIFEKHSHDCRKSPKHLNNENSFFDRGTRVETIGRISIPICEDVCPPSDSAKVQQSLTSQLRLDYTSSSTKYVDRYRNVLKVLETYVRNNEMFDNLNKANVLPQDVLKKYITLAKDLEGKTDREIEELYFRKPTAEQAIQCESLVPQNGPVTPPKWYHWILMCFGLKETEDPAYSNNFNDRVAAVSGESSCLVTRYLKI